MQITFAFGKIYIPHLRYSRFISDFLSMRELKIRML